MDLSRRSFIGLSAASAAGVAAAVALSSPKSATASTAVSADSRGMLVDTTLCIGCRQCEVACKQWNKLPPSTTPDRGVDQSDPPQLDGSTYTKVHGTKVDDQWVYTKKQCMHCQEPACAAACLVGALKKTSGGPVIYDQSRCIGCRYCMMACPFGIPTYQWDKASPWIRKCTFCADRQEQGLQPACSGVCPVGALKFGKRSDLIVAANERIAAEPQLYIPHIYGETEVGGTSWIYLAPAEFETLGFPTLGEEPPPRNAKKAMSALPYYAIGVIALMSGAYWLTKRRQKAAVADNPEKEQ
ncbi:MAG: 4Fe-4S dicluster domain-containing protein [Chloroflexi bacterium]|nr:4Fe-4S dicluster domain-containing protein [Chloroflexota bacterium]